MQNPSSKMNFDIKKAFFALAFVMISVFALMQASAFIIPITYSVLIAFIMLPLCRFFERLKISRLLSLALAFVLVIILLFLVFFFFSAQIYQVISDFDTTHFKIGKIIDAATEMFNKYAPKEQEINSQALNTKIQKIISNSLGRLVPDVFDQTSSLFANLAIMPFYIGLLLLYRRGIHKVLLDMVSQEERSIMSSLLSEIQQVGQKYVGGLVLIILILAVLNSTALFFTGIDSPLLFGVFAACLAVIPYLGTYLGAGLPILYALFNHGDPKMAIAIGICFWAIQMIEGNFLSPKIVGGEVSLNPLASIIAIIVGGYMWGMSGMVLFLPLTAILRVFCNYYEELAPIAFLLGDEITNKKKIEKSEKSKKLTLWFWKKKKPKE